MTTPTTAEILKYADLQMAAEAFLVADKTTGELKTNLKQVLTDGNGHNSRFTPKQAEEFLTHWEVVDQKANTSTGFSGTLFKCIQDDPATGAKQGELVMSLRSTEFIDDAARDNRATNTLEIKETGFAWGQIRDMENWFAQLKADPNKLGGGQPFGVTGYSLGGHLASVFNVLHGSHATAGQANISQVVTFNGAGIGGVESQTQLQTLVDQFKTLSTSNYADRMANADLKALYERVRADLQAGNTPSNGDMATLHSLDKPRLGSQTCMRRKTSKFIAAHAFK